MNQSISKAALARLPDYLRYLYGKEKSGFISSAAIAEELRLNPVLVRKDLATVSDGGKPKTGYAVSELTRDLERFLGYDNTEEAVLAGVGHLGKALLSYGGFQNTGIKVIAAFDSDPDITGGEINGKKIFDIQKLPQLVPRMKVKIGIIAVPKSCAQEVADSMVASGIKGIWNFSPTHLTVPEGVIVKNEDLSASLSLLTKQLNESQKRQGL